MIIPARIPRIIEYLYSQRIWRISTSQRELFLTFDDGPHPRITSAVLDILKKYDAKATFFCIGDRVRQYPEVYMRIKRDGHAVGNHTQHHLNGWKTDTVSYTMDVKKAISHIDSTLFRPPYGRMTGKQFDAVSIMGMKTIMWTVLSGDYEKTLTKEKVFQRVISNMESGNIYLFHDSEKAEHNMIGVLERFIECALNKGYSFSSIVL